jgi:hypothetical protein
MWSPADIADAVEQGFARRARELDEEHAVYGLDVLDELRLHPLIEASFRKAGYGVHREQRYPADRRKRILSEGERCDFVLTAEGRPLRNPEAAATLFDPSDATDLDEAYWLEVKTVSQFTPAGPNPQYASQLLSTVRRDVSKLSKDPDILHAGLLIVLFVEDERVAEHDLRIWHERCIARGLPVGAPAVRLLPITERLGHALCAIAVFPVQHL